MDELILTICGDITLGQAYPQYISRSDVLAKAAAQGSTTESLREALQLLEEESYIERLKESHNDFDHFQLTFAGFEHYAQHHVGNYGAIVAAVEERIVNNGEMDSTTIAGALNQPRLLIAHILEGLNRDGLVGGADRTQDGGMLVWDPSDRLKRRVRGEGSGAEQRDCDYHRDEQGDMTITMSIPPDDRGYIGRECPSTACAGYFKIIPGTGQFAAQQLWCPYCGLSGDNGEFTTTAQTEFAISVALNGITEALLQHLKQLEFDHRPRGGFGIGMSLSVSGQPVPIHQYQEQQLETEVTCNICALQYAIYGVFAFCPSCGTHNSLQMLDKNLDVVERVVALAGTHDGDLGNHLVGTAIEQSVAVFDGFGREICQALATKASPPVTINNLSFQSIRSARQKVQNLFGFDMAAGLSTTDWEFLIRCFQKRHLLSHRMGVVDQAYLDATSDPDAALGRKIRIDAPEVLRFASLLRTLGSSLAAHL